MRITKANFLISVSQGELPVYTTEIAVAGRSNVGKSSFINYLCNNGKLARTSSTPGRTRLINYFDINDSQFVLVDLPGYGYARVSFDEKEKWSKIIENYFQNSVNLKHVFLITDIRVPDSPLDLAMIAYCVHYNISFTIIANKCDKLPKAQREAAVSKLASSFKVGKDNIISVSSTQKLGLEKVLDRIEQVLTSDNKME